MKRKEFLSKGACACLAGGALIAGGPPLVVQLKMKERPVKKSINLHRYTLGG